MASSEARIVALARGGMKPALIAAETGLRPATVYHYLNKARKRGEPIPHFQPGSGWRGQRFLIPLDLELQAALSRAAARRDIDARELARRLLIACVEGALIDAVLDDRDEVSDIPEQGVPS